MKVENSRAGESAEALKGKTGLRRLFNATRYSWQGIRAGFRHEAAFREECLLAVVLIPVALLLPVTALERVILINSVFFLLLTEILNSAIEATIDRIGMEVHPLAGRAKDMGSAAVLFALLMGLVAWGFIALPALAALLG